MVPQDKMNPLDIFRRIEPPGAMISVVKDTERGAVWLFEKPTDPVDPENYRCESNGIVVQGKSY